MTRAVIIGGKLQGLEAVYLGLKAGMEIVLIDKREQVPARGLCHHFVCADLLAREEAVVRELLRADFILPALENEEALKVLAELTERHDLPTAFDFAAYSLTSSKLRSDTLIHEMDIPSPRYYPGCQAPCIAKPCFGSGSHGVRYMRTTEEVETFVLGLAPEEKWVIQEFLAGRSYSIEIVGRPGSYQTYQVTELFMDPSYDCKRVTAPCDIPNHAKDQLADIALSLARALQLQGIMDVEVIDHNGTMKVLEIDARMPSQTPTTVYHSTGVNLLGELWASMRGDPLAKQPFALERYVSYEHLLVGEGQIRVLGEHIMAGAGPLKLIPGFCGADEALTDYEPGKRIWRATFINGADDERELEAKRENMLREIKSLQGEKLEFLDLSPNYE